MPSRRQRSPHPCLADHKDNVPDADDPNVALLRDAGAAVFAKTKLPEFGAGANTVNRVFGATGSRLRWFSGIA
ncbi:MAG: amidase family protein [Thermohalobaculum sp.]